MRPWVVCVLLTLAAAALAAALAAARRMSAATAAFCVGVALGALIIGTAAGAAVAVAHTVRGGGDRFEPFGEADRAAARELLDGPFARSYVPEERQAILKESAKEQPWSACEIEYRPHARRRARGYRSGKVPGAARMNNLHRGQRKLFIAELDCLNAFLPKFDTPAVIVYAGSAPGIHIPLLAALFPATEWHMYDPAPFKYEAGPEGARMHPRNEYFTQQIADSWRGRCDIFICDIRLGDSTVLETFERQIGIDMAAQAAWARGIRPKLGASLKFRPPYVSGRVAYAYLPGRVVHQAWPSGSSTEGRLLVTDATAADEPFDPADYQDSAAELNMIVRPWATFTPPVPGLDRVPGYDRCLDCTHEALAWCRYRELAPGAMSVAGLMRALTKATGQRLISDEVAHGFAAHLPAPRRLAAALSRFGRRLRRPEGAAEK